MIINSSSIKLIIRVFNCHEDSHNVKIDKGLNGKALYLYCNIISVIVILEQPYKTIITIYIHCYIKVWQKFLREYYTVILAKHFNFSKKIKIFLVVVSNCKFFDSIQFWLRYSLFNMIMSTFWLIFFINIRVFGVALVWKLFKKNDQVAATPFIVNRLLNYSL